MLVVFADAFRQRGKAIEEGGRLAQKEAAKSGVQAESRVGHGTHLTSADPSELAAALSDSILEEFKIRLNRIGLEYQTPEAL